MEEITPELIDPTQLQIQFSAQIVKYTKDSKFTCRKSYDGKIFGEILTYRCTHCGEFKNPTRDTRCEKCIKQLDLFGG